VVADVAGMQRAQWASRTGLILAMAGNAIGLGNFLRFPVQAASNGGGAFMIPYFCALIFLGIPLMWIEWTMGRFGGVHGHGSTPGMLDGMWKNRLAKYIGSMGIVLPFAIVVYYNFVESWSLGYAWFSITGKYFGVASKDAMNSFLKGFQGVETNQYFGSFLPMVVFLSLALFVNWYFLSRGISKGIEKLAKYGMPILFLFGILLAIRVLTMGKPEGAVASVGEGMAYVWNPDFSQLSKASVWLAAAGQIFFTLSLGQGIINTYASYLRDNDDVTLNGLTTSSTNEFAEVLLGGTIAIPLAVAFFGLAGTKVIAQEGSFNLGFVSLPMIFQQLPLGRILGFMFFGLIFIAGITSSVAMTSPAIAFLEDEFKWRRSKAVNIVFAVLAACTVLVVVFFKYGSQDEIDFWAGTFGLSVFATIEVIVFSWIFGIKKGWAEMHKGADLKVPRVFKFIIRFVTPVYLLVLLGVWFYQDAIGKFMMKGMAVEQHPYRWIVRGMIVGLFALCCVIIRIAWKRKKALENK